MFVDMCVPVCPVCKRAQLIVEPNVFCCLSQTSQSVSVACLCTRALLGRHLSCASALQAWYHGFHVRSSQMDSQFLASGDGRCACGYQVVLANCCSPTFMGRIQSGQAPACAYVCHGTTGISVAPIMSGRGYTNVWLSPTSPQEKILIAVVLTSSFGGWAKLSPYTILACYA